MGRDYDQNSCRKRNGRNEDKYGGGLENDECSDKSEHFNAWHFSYSKGDYRFAIDADPTDLDSLYFPKSE